MVASEEPDGDIHPRRPVPPISRRSCRLRVSRRKRVTFAFEVEHSTTIASALDRFIELDQGAIIKPPNHWQLMRGCSQRGLYVPTIQYGGYFLLTSLMNTRSGRARPGGCNRDSFADLSSSGRRRCSSHAYSLVRPNRSSTCRDSHFLWVLFLRVAANCHPSQRSGRSNLLRGSDSRPCCGHARRWVVAVSSGKLTAIRRPSVLKERRSHATVTSITKRSKRTSLY